MYHQNPCFSLLICVYLWVYTKCNPIAFLVYSITEIFCSRLNTEMWENWIISGHTKYGHVRLKRNLPHNVRVYVFSRCALWSQSLKISIFNHSINNNFSSQYVLKNGLFWRATIIGLVAHWMQTNIFKSKRKLYRVIKWHLHCSLTACWLSGRFPPPELQTKAGMH